MSTLDIEQQLRQLETDEERVLQWRRDALEQAGYPSRLALKLALRTEVDLHLASELLRRGCPADTAVQILL
ncbi:MAG: hypothetical protein OXG37_00750 [Actinomycetia bacterium]|nr:hypothetical protein [Actinomycetes bacterium]